jgi:hypothetical protein
MAIDPSLAAAHHSLGIAFQTLRRFDDAARAYQWAGELAPRRAQFHINLANTRPIRCRQTLCLPASFTWCCQTHASSTPGAIPSTPASPANYEDVVSDLGGEWWRIVGCLGGGVLGVLPDPAGGADREQRPRSANPVSLRDRTLAPVLAPFAPVVADARLRTGSTKLSANDQIFAVVRGHMTIVFKWRRGRARPRSSPPVMPVQRCMRVPAQVG